MTDYAVKLKGKEDIAKDGLSIRKTSRLQIQTWTMERIYYSNPLEMDSEGNT